MNKRRIAQFILIVTVSGSLVSYTRADTTTTTYKTDPQIEDFLKKYEQDLKSLGQDTTSTGQPAIEFVRNGIYGCKGIGDVGPVGMQHAQGTFVPVSEEAVALNTFILVNKFCVLDGLNVRQREALVTGLTRAGLKQINEGRNGTSKYEGDWRSLMRRQIPDTVMEKLMEDPSLNGVCSPYKERIKRNLVQNYVNTTRKPESIFQCSFPGTDSEMNSLLNGDLEATGWSGFLSALEPGNSELMAYDSLRSLADSTINDEQRRYETELNWGNGFHSDKQCKQVPIGNGKYEENCQIVTPGKVIADMTSFMVQTGQRQTEQADAIDELLGSFVTNLQTEVLSSFSGLQGTTDNSKGASYLDTAVGDAFGRASGETTNVGKDALQKALQTETDYQAVRKTTVDLINTIISQLVALEDECFNKMLDQAKKDLAKKVEDRACSTGGIGACTADVKVDITDDPSSTDANPVKRYKITATIGSEKETATLIKSYTHANDVIKNDIKQLQTTFQNSLNTANAALRVLQGLSAMMEKDNTPATSSFVINRLEQLVKSGSIHTSAHVSNARDQLSQLKTIMQDLYDRTQKNWEGNWCKAEKWTAIVK